MARTTRTEKDSLGELQVPAEALYGAQTQRAVQNFPISGLRMPRGFIRALGLVKAAAAETALEAVTLLARNAWRDGSAKLDDIEAATNFPSPATNQADMTGYPRWMQKLEPSDLWDNEGRNNDEKMTLSDVIERQADITLFHADATRLTEAPPVQGRRYHRRVNIAANPVVASLTPVFILIGLGYLAIFAPE